MDAPEIQLDTAAALEATTVAEPDEDFAVVERVLGGDVQAFELIVRRWQGQLVNMAWRYTRDRGRAEELAQEAFLRAWRNLANWRREGKFSSWLFTLAANIFRTDLKRFPTEMATIDSIAEPASMENIESELLSSREQESIRRAVLALPTLYREAVVLFYFHEMDVASAARTLRIPEGTLKARLKRGRDILKMRFPKLSQHAGNEMTNAMPNEVA